MTRSMMPHEAVSCSISDQRLLLIRDHRLDGTSAALELGRCHACGDALDGGWRQC